MINVLGHICRPSKLHNLLLDEILGHSPLIHNIKYCRDQHWIIFQQYRQDLLHAISLLDMHGRWSTYPPKRTWELEENSFYGCCISVIF